jgi:deazaflavin-dependent oxidoreductase (nitroreductase family)
LIYKTFSLSMMMQVFSAWIGYPPIPVLMIYTIGRKSGQERSTVMPYMFVDGRLYLIGSNGAAKNDPFWVGNLRANPHARILLNARSRT